MHGTTPSTIRREDYRPPDFVIDAIDLEFDLDPKCTRVTAVSRVRRTGPAGAPLRLDGEALELVSVSIDGVALAVGRFVLDAKRLVVADVPDRFELRVVTTTVPESNAALTGLYVSNGNFFTQCEAEGFRRITFFPDRPDVMARYRVTLRAARDRCPVLLSNGNLVAGGDCAPGLAGEARHFAVWEDPFPKPSYLFAVVAGRLVANERTIATRSGRDVLLQVWVEPGNLDKSAHAMESLVHAIRWDERRFGLELDLERFMIVAVGDFNMGAMENKGLNVFNTKYVFATPQLATDADYEGVESVVGHEYFHNWTGNRVTCRDWFQLTLKEGLTVFRDQEFSSDRMAESAATPEAASSARAVKRIADVRVLRAAQFPEDAGPMAHPIRPDAYQEINNFYTVTVYEKGAEVVRMLQTLVGRDGFRAGLDLYFRRHDGQAVTCDDFVAAIADANGADLSQFGRWYSQAGTPRVSVRATHDPAARTLTLRVRQDCPPTPGQPSKEPLHIPLAVGLVGADGRDLPLFVDGLGGADRPAGASAEAPRTVVLELTEAEHAFVFRGVDRPPVPSLGRGFSAPVRIDYDYGDDELAFLAAHDSDPFNRWEAMQRLALESMLRTLAGAPAGPASETLVRSVERALADPGLDPAFKDLVLTLPAESVVVDRLDDADPVRVRETRDGLLERIASQLAPAWRRAWHEHRDEGPYRFDRAGAGRRSMKNTALAYWARTGQPEALAAAHAQYEAADNMTDRHAALVVLLNSADPRREDALASFADRYAGEPLAMDKWFAMQATMRRRPGEPPVVERVRKLLEHPAFTLKNPNRVRSLAGAFCTGNLAEFHAADGSGYQFWTELVLRLDAFNPQVAARIARALDRWRRFTPDRRALMRAELERVAASDALSGDVREIVGAALAN